jgi:hypothetical protein
MPDDQVFWLSLDVAMVAPGDLIRETQSARIPVGLRRGELIFLSIFYAYYGVTFRVTL